MSPIRESGILFYNTLFDENAACHLALGRGYSSNIRDYEKYSLDELRAMGVMNRLREEKGFILQRDVEERLCINRSSVCSILNAIEEKGYIERRSSERDARANVISFTPKAEALNKNAIRQVTEAEKLLTEGLTEAQKKQFAEFILLAKENIEGRRETEKSV